MGRFIMVIMLAAALVVMRVGWSLQKALAATTLDTIYQYKIVNKNSGLVFGISSLTQIAGSTVVLATDNGAADHSWHFILPFSHVPGNTTKQ